MLENLNKTDWKNLTCGLDGSAKRVPELIRQLLKDRRACEQAVRDLQMRINQDGVVFEATPISDPLPAGTAAS